jgi:hypothetical protein
MRKTVTLEQFRRLIVEAFFEEGGTRRHVARTILYALLAAQPVVIDGVYYVAPRRRD